MAGAQEDVILGPYRLDESDRDIEGFVFVVVLDVGRVPGEPHVLDFLEAFESLLLRSKEAEVVVCPFELSTELGRVGEVEVYEVLFVREYCLFSTKERILTGYVEIKPVGGEF